MLSLLIVVGFLLSLLFFDSIAQTAFRDKARMLPGQLTVKRFSPTLWGVKMSEVRWKLDSSETIFKADEIKADIGLGDLFRRDWYKLVHLVSVKKPGLRVTVDRRGHVNLLSLLSNSSDTPAFDFSEFRSRLVLRDGWIVYRDQRDAGFLYELTGWEGEFLFEDGEFMAMNTSVFPNGDQDASVDLEGSFALENPSLVLAVALDRFQLAPFTGFPGFGAGITYLRGAVDGSVRITGSSESWNSLLADLFLLGEFKLTEAAFYNPRMPGSLTELGGTLRFLGNHLSTPDFTGEFSGVSFSTEGTVELGGEGKVKARVETERFDLAKLQQLLDEPLPIEGEARALILARGTLDELLFSGTLYGYDLQAEGHTVTHAQTDFLLNENLLYMSDISADTPAGQVAGEGWVFLGDEIRVLFDFEGRDTMPEVLLPGFAQSADFDLKLLGDPANPVLFGHGDLFGLGSWAQGLSQASGSFIFSGKDLLLYDGVAALAGSRVGLSIGSYNLDEERFTGMVSAEGVSVESLPGVEGITGVFTGNALVDADLSGPEPVLAARARMTSGAFQTAGYGVDDASGELYLFGDEVVIPWANANFAGSLVEASGRYDIATSGVDIGVQSRSMDLGAFGLAGERAGLAASIRGRVDGDLGLYGLAKTRHGDAAISGVRSANGDLRGVAWVDGSYQGTSLKTVAVASGRPERIALEYTGQVVSPELDELGPMDLFGAAELADGHLTIRPTLLAMADGPSDASLYPLTTYSGAAYSFFGPLMSGPLEKVVIEESPFPSRRSVSLAGDANLNTGQMDLRFQMQMAGIEGLPMLGATDELPVRIESAYGDVRGRVTGTFSDPEVKARFWLPWLLFADQQDDQRRVGLGARGRVELSGRTVTLPGVMLTEQPFDPRLRRGEDLVGGGFVGARGYLRDDLNFDLWLRTEGFSADLLAFFAPKEFQGYIPSGRFATESLHLWGSLDQPNVAGEVNLHQGGFMAAGRPYALRSIYADFSSQRGDLHLSKFALSALGVDVSGDATWRSDGGLDGSIVARDVKLKQLHRFDPLLAGFEGNADLVVTLGGSFPGSPMAEAGLRTNDLTWNPKVIGGRDEIISIENLVLGVWEDDGPGLLQGLTIAPLDGGIYLEIPDAGLQFVRTDDGLKIDAHGAVTMGSPAGMEFKTFSEMARYFASPSGPDFGRDGDPLKIAVTGLTTSEAALLTGRSTQGVELSTSFELALEGQWWRDHALSAGDGLPHYRWTFDELKFESGEEEDRSGIELHSIASLDYQREGTAGYLSLEDWLFGFFRTEPALKPTGDDDEEQNPIYRQGVVDAEGHLAITRLAGTEPFSEFNLGAADIPLANMAFLLPDAVSLDGLVEQFEVSLGGVLPSPTLIVQGVVSALKVGPLENMRIDGDVYVDQEGDAYRLIVGRAENEGINLSFSDNAPEVHGAVIDGEVDIFWEEDGDQPDDRLVLFGHNLSVSLQSPLDLIASFTDQNLEILAGLVPGKERTSGTLRAKIATTGTLGFPEFEGGATLQDGRFLSDRYGHFDNLQLDSQLRRITRDQATETVVLEGASSDFLTRWNLARLEGTLGGVPFYGGGVAEFAGIAPTLIDIFFMGESLPVSIPELYVGRADVDLELQGRVLNPDSKKPTLRPLLGGLISLPAGELTLPLSMDSEVLEEGANQDVPMDIDLDVSLGSEFFVNALNSRIRAVGDLEFLAVDGMAQLMGVVELSRGVLRIPFYDASFRVRQGLAIFDGPLIPRLEDVEAVADMGGYRISARANGRFPDTFRLDLYSDPPLPQAELSRIAVLGGMPSALTGSVNSNGEASSGAFDSMGTTGMSFLSGMLTNRLTEQIGNLLFLSELSFDYIPPATYAIKVAKALDPHDRFLLTLTRIIRDNGLSENLFGIEWRFTRTFLARIAFDEMARARLWVQSINRF